MKRLCLVWGLLLGLSQLAYAQPTQWGPEEFDACLLSLEGEVESSQYVKGLVKSFSGALDGLAYRDINLNQPAKADFVNILIPRGGTTRWKSNCGEDGNTPRCWSYVKARHIVCNPAMGSLLASISHDQKTSSEDEVFELFAQRFWAASVIGHEFGHFIYEKSPGKVSHAFPAVREGAPLTCQENEEDEREETRFDQLGLQLACFAVMESRVGREKMLSYLDKLDGPADGALSLLTISAVATKTAMAFQQIHVRDDLCVGTSAYESAAYRSVRMGEGVARCFNDDTEKNLSYELASRYSSYVDALEDSLRRQQKAGAAAHPHYDDEIVFGQRHVQAPASEMALVGFANSFNPVKRMEYGRIWLFVGKDWKKFDSQIFFEWPGTIRLLDSFFEGQKLLFFITLKELKQDKGTLRASHKILQGSITCSNWSEPATCQKSVLGEAAWDGKGAVVAHARSNHVVIVNQDTAKAYQGLASLQQGTAQWEIKAMFSTEPLKMPHMASPDLFVASGFDKNGLYSFEGVVGKQQRFALLDIPPDRGVLKHSSVNDKSVLLLFEKEGLEDKARYEFWQCPISSFFGKPGTAFKCNTYASMGDMNAFSPAEVISSVDAVLAGELRIGMEGCPAQLAFASFQGWTWVLNTKTLDYALFAGNGVAGCAKDGKLLSYRAGRVDQIEPAWLKKALSASTVDVTIFQGGEKPLPQRGSP